MTDHRHRGPGRPALYTAELAERVCSLIAAGETDGSIERMKGLPSADTIRRWKRDNPEFCGMYARAREARADLRSERIDGYVTDMIAGKLAPDAARVAIQAEQWQAGKEQPRRYGDKIAHVGGGPEDPPIKADVDLVDAARRVAFMLGKAVREQGLEG